MSIVSDRKLIDSVSAGIVISYAADVIFSVDYYPYGMQMPGREMNRLSYRYGFAGMEKDNGFKDNANSYDFGARMYDPRLGKFLSRDAYEAKYPYHTPYQYAADNPIVGLDINGDSLYVLFYVDGYVGHGGDDDKMFEASALTRKRDIEAQSHFDPAEDKVVVIAVQDLSLIHI